MRIINLLENRNHYLYEGLENAELRTVRLWESAGYAIREAALTPDQIQSLFAEIEKGATAGGNNRTMLGKGKDAAEAVNKAWEDLKTKIQDSAPIKNVDAAYDSAVGKIEAGLGGPDNKINQVIQKYRQFAKEHPIAQGLIYSALIAAAGISGAGLGGAAVLGLLKMTDKLLQGEKFSSAAYQGGKTGAMAYGASKIADMFKGGDKAADAATAGLEKGLSPEQIKTLKELGASGKKLVIQDGSLWYEGPDGLVMLDAPDGSSAEAMLKVAQSAGKQAGAASSYEKGMAGARARVDAANAKLGVDGSAANYDATGTVSQAGGTARSIMNNATGSARDRIMGAIEAGKIDPGDTMKMRELAEKVVDQVGGSLSPSSHKIAVEKAVMMTLKSIADENGGVATSIGGKLVQSIERSGTRLSEGQVYMVINRVCARQLDEGVWDSVKGAAGKAVDWAKTKGKNLTTTVTADKLNSAWQKAGAPTDSEELKQFLTGQGVEAGVIDSVYSSLKISSGAAKEEPAAQSTYAQIKKDVQTLDKKGRQRIMAYLQKQLGTA